MKSTLRTLLTAIPDGVPSGKRSLWDKLLDQPVAALVYDSRKAVVDSVFFCLVGKTADGHSFARAAYRNGCRIFVVERFLELPPDAVQYRTSNTRRALADCAAELYGHPERQMRLVGLTGTKGKTTTALLIRSLLEANGIPAGYIGTNGIDYRQYHYETVNSTPESLEIYRFLHLMLKEGVKVCVLEVSSQALWMERIRGLQFDTVLFTNLSRDHIGGVEHPDFQHYRACKRLLFTDYGAEAAVVNIHHPHTPFMTEGISTPILGFGLAQAPPSPCSAVWSADRIRPSERNGRIGVSFDAIRISEAAPLSCFVPLPGGFNVENALAALTVVCERFGIAPARAVNALAEAVVPGRFETVTHPALPGVTFVIDYAHNGASLAAILDALRDYAPGRLLCLFGSVGGRTVERRKDLAEAAGPRCDLCILTSDNPASEPPESIIADIDRAFPPDSCPRVSIPDRAEAIRYAVGIAEEGDIILLAGKGHETYQLVGVKRIPFSEIEILSKALEERASLPLR